MNRFGPVLGVLGAALVIAAALFSGAGAMRPTPDCPQPTKASPPRPQVYLTSAEIRLGGLLCLALDRSRFFERERRALTAAEGEVRKAEEDLRTATPATATAAQTRLTQARNGLDALPRERMVFIFFDDVKVPAEGNAVAVVGPAGESEWALLQIPLRFTEDASSAAGADWRRILGGPNEGGRRAVRVGVAVGEAEDRTPVRAVIRQPATLRVYDPIWLIVGGLGLVLLAVGIGISGWNTGLLRDGGKDSQFSLARVQMAWWLVLATGGFLFIWLVSGQWLNVMTGGTIALLGISATTGVAARMIDDRTTTVASKDFWTDIVSETNGAALHRIQLIAWTILLGGIFVWTVIWTFAFPDFDTNLLLLAGIAGGTYLGFKFKE